MKQEWTPEEIAHLVKGRKILKTKGLAKDADVKTICEAAGISRKTGYQWAEKEETAKEKQKALKKENEELRAEVERLRQEKDDLRFENEGRKLAWKLHDVDELIKNKKKRSQGIKKPKP